jgi:diguanylate cyclase (GGDEF)-like protein
MECPLAELPAARDPHQRQAKPIRALAAVLRFVPTSGRLTAISTLAGSHLPIRMNSDPSTIFQAVALVYALFAVVYAVSGELHCCDSTAASAWAAANACLALAVAISLLNFQPQDLVLRGLSEAIRLVGYGWLLHGCRVHFAAPRRRQTPSFLPALALGSLLVVQTFGDLALRTATYDAGAAWLLFMTGRVVHRGLASTTRAMVARLVAAPMTVAAAIQAFCCTAALVATSPWTSDAMQPTLFNVGLGWVSLAGALIVNFSTLGLLLRRQPARLDGVTRNDPLTGASNQLGIEESLKRELRLHEGRGNAVSLICFDLDHFKAVTDRHGHAAGEAILKHAVLSARDPCRSSDSVARIAGGAFCIAMPSTSAEGALCTAERIRRTLESATCTWRGLMIPVTASFGSASAMASEGATATSIMNRAQHAMDAAQKNSATKRADAARFRLPPRGSIPLRLVVPTQGKLSTSALPIESPSRACPDDGHPLHSIR